LWHEADVPARSNDVCSWGKTGRHMLVESLSGFDLICDISAQFLL
jgi:hypothetical protein